MKFARFQIIDRSKAQFLIKTKDTHTVGDMLDDFFPSSKSLTLQQRSQTAERLLRRSELIKHIMIEGYLSPSPVEYHLVDVDDYVDVYVNAFTRSVLNCTDQTVRLYCSETSTIADLEGELSSIFQKERGLVGIYGVDKALFKLRDDGFVLFIKSCFAKPNFFQLQLRDCVASLQYIRPRFEGRFYRLDYVEQKVTFKKTHLFSLRETALVKMRNGCIADTFFDINNAEVVLRKSYMKNIIKIQAKDRVWILSSFSESITYDMYQELLAVKDFNRMREIENKYSRSPDIVAEKKRIHDRNTMHDRKAKELDGNTMHDRKAELISISRKDDVYKSHKNIKKMEKLHKDTGKARDSGSLNGLKNCDKVRRRKRDRDEEKPRVVDEKPCLDKKSMHSQYSDDSRSVEEFMEPLDKIKVKRKDRSKENVMQSLNHALKYEEGDLIEAIAKIKLKEGRKSNNVKKEGRLK